MSFHAFGQCFQLFIDTALQKPDNMFRRKIGTVVTLSLPKRGAGSH